MCIKINLKQTLLARLFFFVIYDDKIAFMHLRWGEEERPMLPTLRVSAHSQSAPVPLGDSNLFCYNLLHGGEM